LSLVCFACIGRVSHGILLSDHRANGPVSITKASLNHATIVQFGFLVM
jgi:hypothetical protein